jgi:hypothetical protein
MDPGPTRDSTRVYDRPRFGDTGAMRSHVLAASTLALIPSGHLVVQSIQERPTDHDHPPIGLLSARQLAVKPFTTLPKGVLFLRLENFSTTKAAQDAATSASAVVEWAGKDLVVHAWTQGDPLFRWNTRRGDWPRSGRPSGNKLCAGH